MAFFGRNTAGNTARFAQDMSAYRKDTEAANLREEISKAGQDVLQFFSGLSPEQQADPANISKLVGILKSKGYSEQALVAGVSVAQGYAKASAQTQSQLEETKLRKAQNQNIEDVNATQSAIGQFQKLSDNFQGPLEKLEIAAGRGLSDKQFGTYRGALAEIKNNSEQAKYDRMEQMSVINKNNRVGLPKPLSTSDLKANYANSVQAVKTQMPGLTADPDGVVGGTFKKEEAQRLAALAKANGVNLYTEKGEPIDEHFLAFWKADTPTLNIKLMPRGTQAMEVPTAPTSSTAPVVAPKTDTSGLAAAIDSKDMDIVKGSQNDPNAIKVTDIPPPQTVPNNGQTVVQKMATGNISGPSIMDSIRKKTQSIMGQETKPSLLGQTGAATPHVNKQPTTLGKLETAAPGLNVKTVKNEADVELQKILKTLKLTDGVTNVNIYRSLKDRVQAGDELSSIEKKVLEVLEQAYALQGKQDAPQAQSVKSLYKQQKSELGEPWRQS